MLMAEFFHGSPTMVDHTPGSAVSAGDVVVTNDTPRVAHVDIAASTLGDLATGGGVYKMTADGAIGADKKVYWNAVASKVTLTAGSNKIFGVTTTAAAADGDPIYVRHDPAA